MRTLSDEAAKHLGETITIEGWLHKKRLLGGLTFINVRDRRGLIQIVIKDKDEVEKLRGMQIGTVLRVEGNVKEEPRAPGGAELHDVTLEVLVPVTDEPPIEIDKPIDHKSENLDTLFDYRVISLRNLRETAIFKIQDRVMNSAREYFYEHDFTEMKTPKLLAEATEGGAEVFKLDYFGKEAFLAQSAQFYKQIMVGVFERVFEMGGTYRAEPSATTRHMTEFITIDAELGFITFDELLEFAHGMMKHVVDRVWEQCEPELKLWQATKPLMSDKPTTITMAEVHKLYSEAHKIDLIDEPDLRPDEERWICDYAKKNLGTEAVFVTKWATGTNKFMFYHKANDEDPSFADRADFLFRGVEIMTVPMREHRYERLIAQMEAKGIDHTKPGFKHYLMAFKHGLPPHGGFGWGLERTTQEIIGLNNVKEATLFPRDINRLAP
jgi:nondiscriminating aspartyl-tRNA synthetase